MCYEVHRKNIEQKRRNTSNVAFRWSTYLSRLLIVRLQACIGEDGYFQLPIFTSFLVYRIIWTGWGRRVVILLWMNFCLQLSCDHKKIIYDTFKKLKNTESLRTIDENLWISYFVCFFPTMCKFFINFRYLDSLKLPHHLMFQLYFMEFVNLKAITHIYGQTYIFRLQIYNSIMHINYTYSSIICILVHNAVKLSDLLGKVSKQMVKIYLFGAKSRFQGQPAVRNNRSK